MDRRSFLLTAAGLALAPRSLAYAAPAARKVVLATADLESRLVAVDLATGAILGHIPTLAYPRSIETVGVTAVVAHSELGAVTLLDGATRRIRHVLHGFAEPRYTAGHPDGRHAYVTDAARGELVALDLHTGAMLAREPVGPLARHVGIDAAGDTVWVALGSKAEELAIVDVTSPARPRLLRRIRPPFLAHDVAWAPDGRHVWVSAGASRELAVYHAPTRRVVARLPADAPPQHITFDPDTAFVTSGLAGTLQRHTLEGQRLSVTRVPEGSYNVQYADGRVVTAALGHGTLAILAPDGTVHHLDQIARSSHDACIVSA
jgi:DNA-binding beta-propeller fold protein YncE